MLVEVFGDIHEFKILNAVVSLVAVSMVNVLTLCKRSSEILFHDSAVFSDIPSVATDIVIAVSRLKISSAFPEGIIGSCVSPPLPFGFTLD